MFQSQICIYNAHLSNYYNSNKIKKINCLLSFAVNNGTSFHGMNEHKKQHNHIPLSFMLKKDFFNTIYMYTPFKKQQIYSALKTEKRVKINYRYVKYFKFQNTEVGFK